MAFIPAVDTVKVTLQYSDATNNVMENVYHMTKVGGFADTDFVTLAEDWVAADGDHMAPNRNQAVTLDTVTVLGLEVHNGRVYVQTVTPPQPGELTGNILPGNVTVAASWRTGFSGRSFRGRTYHIGLEDTQVVANRLTDTALANVLAGYQALLADWDDTTGVMVVASYFADGGPRTAAVLTPITSCSVNQDTDSQRRRLNGRGR